MKEQSTEIAAPKELSMKETVLFQKTDSENGQDVVIPGVQEKMEEIERAIKESRLKQARNDYEGFQRAKADLKRAGKLP